jgi:lipoprotein-anchoring transpeptidase ErfK/SrfK
MSLPHVARLPLIVLAVVVPIVPVLIGLDITAGRAASGPLAMRAAGGPTPGPTPPTRRTGTAQPPGQGAIVAAVDVTTVMRTAPGGHAIARVGRRTTYGSPTVLLVTALRPGWLGVLSPQAGNGHIGWIPDSSASLSRVTWQLQVSLRTRRLTVIRNGRFVSRYTVAIGRTDAPTPAGHFAVTDLLTTGDPSGPYGCCILALSARAPHAIQGWGGGDRIAIHSTPEESTLGENVSHGCVRVAMAAGRWLLDHVPLGTPTAITA